MADSADGAGQAHFAEINGVLWRGTPGERREERRCRGEIGCGITEFQAAGDVEIDVMRAEPGAAAGFAGALYIIGPNGGRFLQAFSPGFGFLAITVALLARLNPWASLVAALFYATMMGGTTGLQSAGVPFPIVNVLQGLIIITITATFIVNRGRRKRRLPAAEPVQLDKAEMRKGVTL